MMNNKINTLVKTLKILSKEGLTVNDWKKREWVTFIDKIEIDETENNIYISGQAMIDNGDVSNKIQPVYSDFGVIIDNYTFKLDKNIIEDWDIHPCLNIECIGGYANTITVEFEEELLVQIGDIYVEDLAKMDNMSVDDKITEMYEGDVEVDFKKLTYKQMDYYYQNYYKDVV